MNPMMMELLPLVHQGYCCSQLLLLLMLQAQDRQNPGVVRAAQGLCHGIGQSDGPCGLLTGGACALALAAGKGAEDEIPHPMCTRRSRTVRSGTRPTAPSPYARRSRPRRCAARPGSSRRSTGRGRGT